MKVRLDMGRNPQMGVSFRDIAATSYLLRDRITSTLCVRSKLTNYFRCKTLVLKLEYKQNGGSYKTRGAFNALMTLPRAVRKKGVIVASQGNHAIAFSYAARKLNTPVTIVFPRIASPSKIQMCRNYGAKIIINGDSIYDSIHIARKIGQREHKKFINILTNVALGVGNATVGIELAQQASKMDFCIIPFTMERGILKGLQVAIKKMRPCCKIYAVKCASKTSSRLGVTGDPSVDCVIEVSEEDIHEAFLLLVEVEKVLVEPNSAMTLAALCSRKCPEFIDKNVVCFLGNGNIDLAMVTKLLARSSAVSRNLITFSVSVTDEIGSLQRLYAEIANNNVSVRDIVFPKNSSIDKLIVFCETSGPDHSKTFIRNMTAVYPDFEVIPLSTATRDQRLESRPFRINDRRKNEDHVEDGVDSRLRSTDKSKDAVDNRGSSSYKSSRDASTSTEQRLPSDPVSQPTDMSSDKEALPQTGRISSDSQSSSSYPRHVSPLLLVYGFDDEELTQKDESEELNYNARDKKQSILEDSNESMDAIMKETYEGGAVLGVEYEQMDQQKISTIERYDNNFTLLESTRVEEKRSVTRAGGMLQVNDEKHVGTRDKVVQTTLIARQRTQPRYTQRLQKSHLTRNKSPESLKQRQETDIFCPCSTAEMDSGVIVHCAAKEAKDENRIMCNKEDHTSKKAKDTMDQQHPSQIASNQSDLGPLISFDTDTIDDQECYGSKVSISNQTLPYSENRRGSSSPATSKWRKCRKDTGPFLD